MILLRKLGQDILVHRSDDELIENHRYIVLARCASQSAGQGNPSCLFDHFDKTSRRIAHVHVWIIWEGSFISCVQSLVLFSAIPLLLSSGNIVTQFQARLNGIFKRGLPSTQKLAEKDVNYFLLNSQIKDLRMVC